MMPILMKSCGAFVIRRKRNYTAPPSDRIHPHRKQCPDHFDEVAKVNGRPVDYPAKGLARRPLNPDVCVVVCGGEDSYASHLSPTVEFEALFPTIANGLVVLAPQSHELYIPVLASLEFEGVPFHLPVVRIKGEIKPILVGQAVVIKIVTRCGEVCLIVGSKRGVMVRERVG